MLRLRPFWEDKLDNFLNEKLANYELKLFGNCCDVHAELDKLIKLSTDPSVCENFESSVNLFYTSPALQLSLEEAGNFSRLKDQNSVSTMANSIATEIMILAMIQELWCQVRHALNR